MGRFLGPQRAEQAFAGLARGGTVDLRRDRQASAELVRFGERLMAGAIGAASARDGRVTLGEAHVDRDGRVEAESWQTKVSDSRTTLIAMILTLIDNTP